MSEMETHKGKLVPMTLSGVTLEERAEDACRILGYKWNQDANWYDSWLEVLQMEGYRKVFVRGDVIYEVQDQELDSFGFAEATHNDDGTIDYIMSYYNGGASFDEALGAAVKDDSTD